MKCYKPMLNASIAVLTRPSVSTFEEYEQDNLQWAIIYVAIGAIITGILGAISFAIQSPMADQQLRELQEQLGDLGTQIDLTGAAAQPSLIGSVFSNVLGALIGFSFF